MANTGKAAEKFALDLDEAAARVSLSKGTLRGAIAAGQLRSLKVGRRRLVRPEDLSEWLESSSQETYRPSARRIDPVEPVVRLAGTPRDHPSEPETGDP